MTNNKIYFHYDKNTSQKNREATYNTIVNLKNKVKKNKNFFCGLNIWLINDINSVNNNSILFKAIKKANDFDYYLGVTCDNNLNKNKREILINDNKCTILNFFKKNKCTTAILNFFIKNKKATEKDIECITLHELGHQFDEFFAKPNNEIVDYIKKFDEEGLLNDKYSKDSMYLKYIQEDCLSDSKEFIDAWKKDVEKLGKSKNMHSIIDKLAYFSPFSFTNNDDDKNNDIDITDGLSQKEIQNANSERMEEFAQLFSYALGGEISIYDKETITETYANSYKVVKKYIKQYFGN